MRHLVYAVIVLAATNAQSQTAPYRLNAGDTIDVNVYQDPKLNRQAVIAPDGTITFPLAGSVRAAGRTLGDVESQLRERLRKNFTGDLDVTVALQGVKPAEPSKTSPDAPLTPVVYITGEVGKPGSYEIRRPTYLMQAIALSGGFGAYAATGRVQIRRKVNGQELVMAFNYNNYQAGIDASGNIRLLPGDIIIVPERGLFE